ncbi:MAG TPA: hypothetical protein VMD05_11320 [Candidatus Nanoarchaeia archaeon]|nr:hypothetical protein [Candidatus Nanoarchaeia archaeon]
MKSISFSSLPFNKSSVFAIIDTTLTGKATSDILYIGRSKRPTRRILGGYLSGYGSKNTKKINADLFENGYIEKAAITWIICDKPKTMQKELMDKYVLEHGESPLWNGSKKKNAKVSRKTTSTAKLKTTTPVAAAKNAKTKRNPKPKSVPKTATSAKPTTTTKPAASADSDQTPSNSTQKPEA